MIARPQSPPRALARSLGKAGVRTQPWVTEKLGASGSPSLVWTMRRSHRTARTRPSSTKRDRRSFSLLRPLRGRRRWKGAPRRAPGPRRRGAPARSASRGRGHAVEIQPLSLVRHTLTPTRERELRHYGARRELTPYPMITGSRVAGRGPSLACEVDACQLRRERTGGLPPCRRRAQRLQQNVIGSTDEMAPRGTLVPLQPASNGPTPRTSSPSGEVVHVPS